MKSTDELHQGELARRAEEFRSASQDRNVERMLALFADDAEVTMAPGTFRGKAAIRKFLKWEVRMAPVATSTALSCLQDWLPDPVGARCRRRARSGLDDGRPPDARVRPPQAQVSGFCGGTGSAA